MEIVKLDSIKEQEKKEFLEVVFKRIKNCKKYVLIWADHDSSNYKYSCFRVNDEEIVFCCESLKQFILNENNENIIYDD